MIIPTIERLNKIIEHINTHNEIHRHDEETAENIITFTRNLLQAIEDRKVAVVETSNAAMTEVEIKRQSSDISHPVGRLQKAIKASPNVIDKLWESE